MGALRVAQMYLQIGLYLLAAFAPLGLVALLIWAAANRDSNSELISILNNLAVLTPLVIILCVFWICACSFYLKWQERKYFPGEKLIPNSSKPAPARPMARPTWLVTGTEVSTGREVVRELHAADEDVARVMAEMDGIVIKDIKIKGVNGTVQPTG